MQKKELFRRMRVKLAFVVLGLTLVAGPAAAQEAEKDQRLNVEGAQKGVPISELPEGSEQAKALKKEIETNFEFMTAKALNKARRLLEDYGKFYPFGVAVGPNGKVNFAWTVSRDEENPNIDPGMALAALRQSLAANASAKRLLATAIVYQYGQVNEEGELVGQQVNVELEYVTGAAKVRAAPYEKTADGRIEFTGLGEKEIEPRVFAELLADIQNAEASAQ